MSLATRCTACDTVFRVVEDQLKVSDGWVRCGRCTAVFNAREHLFDLDAAAACDTNGAPGRDDAAALAGPAGDAAAEGFAPGEADAIGHGHPAAPQPAVAEAAEAQSFEPAQPGESPVEPPTVADGDDAVRVSIGQSAAAHAARPVAIDADEATSTPSFLRGSGPDAFWRRPAVRGTMAGMTVALSLALALQAVVLWRNELASAQPGARAALESMCEALGCRISALRRLEHLSIDASGLIRVDGAPLHRLAVTVRNRADFDVLAPAVELTLTDVQGAVLARRVLALAELGHAEADIAAGREVPLQAVLSTGEGRIHGYTVELFYP